MTIQSLPDRPDGSAHPRTHTNLAHRTMVVSWELLDDDDRPYRRLFYRRFEDEGYRRLEAPEEVNFPSEVLHPQGDWLYAVRWTERPDSPRDRVDIVRWHLDGDVSDSLEQVTSHQHNFGYEDFECVWPNRLLTVEESGDLVGVFSGHPAAGSDEMDAAFRLGRLLLPEGDNEFLTGLSGPGW